MIINNTNNWRSPVRNIKAEVELFSSSSLAQTFTSYDALKSFSIERLGESKFFGFGICQKTNIHLIDKDRLINITTENSFKNYIGTTGDLMTSFPTFYVTEVHRDENTNELSITAYDSIYQAQNHTISELELMAPYTIYDVALSICNFLNLGQVVIEGVSDSEDPFLREYPEGANIDGAETLREILNDIAEATQTIYYLNKDNHLVFKRLDVNGAAVLTITKEDYITLNSKTNRRLSAICSATELGDNVIDSLDAIGTTQFIRNNPFWDIQEDVDVLVSNALAAVGGLTINQFDCSWRGNAALELGDKIDLITKDDSAATSFLLNDTFTYDGGLSQKSSWQYEDSAETATNPVTLGDKLKQTYAKVDKANKQIEIVVSEVSGYTDSISKIEMSTDNIVASVSQLDTNVSELSREVNAKMSAEEVNISIKSALEEGTERVTTSTGFTFNEEGLHISKENSEITTSITEDGMAVYRNDDEVLTADNLGVKAEDLHATTFLIIGNNSRFEDYDNYRTGCFWIGG